MPHTSESRDTDYPHRHHAFTSLRALASGFSRLSSGFRVHVPEDHARGVSIDEGLKSRLNGYACAERNANDAMAIIQTANEAIAELRMICERMGAFVGRGVTSAPQADVAGMADGIATMQSEVRRVLGSATWNQRPLFGRDDREYSFNIGAGGAPLTTLTVVLGGLDTDAILSESAATTPAAFAASIDRFGATLFASQRRGDDVLSNLGTAISNIQTARLNVAAAGSRIEDVAVADESAHLGREQVLASGPSSVMAQTNLPHDVALNLLR